MTGAVAAISRPGAGRVEPVALGLRAAEPTRAEAALLARLPFRSGASPLHGFVLDVEWRVEAESARARVRVRNASAAPQRLESVLLGLEWRGLGVSSLRYLKNGWQSWSYTGSRALDAAGEPAFPSGAWLRGLHHVLGAPPADRAGWHESHLVTVVGAAPGPVCCVGVCEQGRSFGVVYARRAGDAVQIEVEWQIDAELPPGGELELEPLHVALGDEASALLETYAHEYGRGADARVSRPFVAGWCSWYYAFHDVSEDDVLRNLEALTAARDAIPVDVVQIDDGYQRAIGDWLVTNAKFPRGLAPLAQEIRAAGFAPGIWTAPFCAVRESEIFAKHPDWWLRTPDGKGELLLGLLHPGWSADASVFVLDAGRSDVLAHLQDVHGALAEMGFQYLKVDFLYTQALAARSAEPALGRAARLRRGLEAIRAGIGEETFLLGCGSPLGAAVGIVDGMRIGPDVAPHWYPAGVVPGIEETLPSTRSALRSSLARAWMHRRLWSNDPDCLMVRAQDTQLTADERRALAAVVATTGGMVLFSDDLTRLTPPEHALLDAALRAGRAVDTAGLPGVVRVPGLLAEEIPTRAVATDGGDTLVARLDTRDAPRDATQPGAERDASADLLELCADAERLDALQLSPRSGRLLRLRSAARLAVFCDFDGTFSTQDVGATLAARHGGPRRPVVWASYERGEIRAWDYNLAILDGLALPERDLEAFLRNEVSLDPGARDLLRWCAQHAAVFRILSDGFDWNLNRLQAIHRVSFAYTANHLRYESGRWRIRAGWPDSTCGCGTGTCKGGYIREFRATHPGALLVHIGNGRVSDTCGALAADLAFAKDSLADELLRRGVGFRPFETLHDVIRELETLPQR